MQDGSIFGTIGGGSDEEKVKRACFRAMQTGRPELVVCEHFGRPGQPICGGYAKIFIEPFIGKRHLLICGAGHIALPLSAIGKMLNFNVTVIDPRKKFANKKRFPHVDQVVAGQFKTKLAAQAIDRNTFVITGLC